MSSRVERFMQSYKAAWEGRDDELLCSLFTKDGIYRNTPFDAQHGHEAIARYWDRVKLQEDITLDYEVVTETDTGGVATWTVIYQVSSEEMFQMWAKSTGTGLPDRKPGDPLPRLRLGGIAVITLGDDDLCTEFRIWWHSQVIAAEVQHG